MVESLVTSGVFGQLFVMTGGVGGGTPTPSSAASTEREGSDMAFPLPARFLLKMTNMRFEMQAYKINQIVSITFKVFNIYLLEIQYLPS